MFQIQQPNIVCCMSYYQMTSKRNTAVEPLSVICGRSVSSKMKLIPTLPQLHPDTNAAYPKQCVVQQVSVQGQLQIGRYMGDGWRDDGSMDGWMVGKAAVDTKIFSGCIYSNSLSSLISGTQEIQFLKTKSTNYT